MALPSAFLCFLSLSSLLLISASSSSPSITLSLSPIPTSFLPSSNSWELISHIVNSTLNRAKHLKRKTSPVFHGTSKTPLYARSYGGYSVSLSFGTPPQKIPLVFDTGSSLLWVPCTSRYLCKDCNFTSHIPKISTFKPKLSSSARIVGCRNPKCGWLFGPDVKARCPGCGPRNCSQTCPGYVLQYGSGSTAGLAVVDSLDLPGGQVARNFLLGCSLLSIRQPEGIAGFGRASTSLPNQLKLGSFSYCLLSHKFDDDRGKSSSLVLVGRPSGGKVPAAGAIDRVRYTPFHKNPTKSPYDEYYYVNLRKITVGRTHVKLPSRLLVPGPDGNGGTIVDSGSTFSYMERALFNPFVRELAAQMAHYKRARNVEAQSGFGLCLHISSKGNVSFPELAFHFKGGARMDLPLSNYFSFVAGPGVLCLTIVSDASPAGPGVAGGPAMVLGNYQQQNFYIEYDLVNQKFGFKKQKCG